MLIRVAAVALIVATCPLAACATPVSVDVRKNADDGLTSRLADSVNAGLQARERFRFNSQSPDLIITFPSSVDWKEMNGKTVVNYIAIVSDKAGLRLGESKGECLESELARCASKIVADTDRLFPMPR